MLCLYVSVCAGLGAALLSIWPMRDGYIYRFLLVHGYRQELLGETPIWFGHSSAYMLCHNFPFNPEMRDLPVRCRSRLYPEHNWLRHSTDLLCIGISEPVSFPGAESAGLGLFADCSANLEVPFEDLNPNTMHIVLALIA